MDESGEAPSSTAWLGPRCCLIDTKCVAEVARAHVTRMSSVEPVVAVNEFLWKPNKSIENLGSEKGVKIGFGNRFS